MQALVSENNGVQVKWKFSLFVAELGYNIWRQLFSKTLVGLKKETLTEVCGKIDKTIYTVFHPQALEKFDLSPWINI